jgi:tetratricopeptide (TPR) repeat protein
MKILIIIVIFSLSLTSLAQSSTKTTQYSKLDSIEKLRVDSLIYERIPFNALKAKEDINNDTIRIIRLVLAGTPANTNEETTRLENRFGFFYDYEYLRLPNHHLKQKEEEYNNIVYQYLDSLFGFDTKREVYSEVVRMWWERNVVSNRTDRELRKYINKTLRGESKINKKQIFEIDKFYRDKKFRKAIDDYNQILSFNLTNQTTDYVLNSIYYCYLNMLQFEKANDFRKRNLKNTKLTKK